MTDSSTKPIRGAGAHEGILQDILAGRWVPGEKLQPGVLAEYYQTSTTVIREALTRLAGEMFVVVRPNRGFSVPVLSLGELRDLTEVRCLSEGLAIGLAIERGTIGWESEVIAAHHQLSRTPRRGSDDPEHVANAWANAHRAFHAKLIEACQVPVLVHLSKRLADSTELYRRWAAPSLAAVSRNVEGEHAGIVQAVLQRDAPLAAERLRRHYETTVDVVLDSGLVAGVDGAVPIGTAAGT